MTNLQIAVTVVTCIALVAICAFFTLFILGYRKTSVADIEAGIDDPSLVDKALESSKITMAKRVLSWIWKILAGIILVACIFGMALSIYSRVSGNLFPVGDKTYITITSGSMSEKNSVNTYLDNTDDPRMNYQIDSYSIITINKYSSEEQVNQYDVVAYETQEGTIVVHRIVDVLNDEDETVQYVTKGDANVLNDTEGASPLISDHITFDSILGYYDGHSIPKLGYAVVFLQSPVGIMTVVALAYCFVVYDYVAAHLERSRKARVSRVLDLLNIRPDQTDNIRDIESVTIDGRKYSFVDRKLRPLDDSEPAQTEDKV